jgi:4-hydroxybenzoate polyprenyltransferase
MSKKRSFVGIIWGFFLLTHPERLAFLLVGVAVFALLASWPHLVWTTLVLLVAAHGAMQASIAVLNDYCDRRLDALSKPQKPLVRGLVMPGEALVAGLLMILLMLVLLFFLPPLALLVSLIYLVLGQSYNLRLKSTPWSGVVVALAMPLLPVYAWVGVGRSSLAIFWMVPVGLLLGVALHLANALPDVESDKAGGAQTLAVWLGVQRSFLLCPLLIVGAVALMSLLLLMQLVPVPVWIIAALLGIAILAVVTMASWFGPQKPPQTRTVYFYVVVVTCLLLGVSWFVIVTR